MVTGNGILSELTSFRAELRAHAADYQPLLQLTVWRPLLDVVIDGVLVAVAVLCVVQVGLVLAPLAVVLIGSRQRALGNVLHDAGHRNLHRSRRINDTLASALVAPLVFADLAAYRDTHFRHHLQLGSEGDPDKLSRPTGRATWLKHYRVHLFSPAQWWGSIVGHLSLHRLAPSRKLYIVTWWVAACLLLGVLAGRTCLLTFLMLWMTARATAFHAITTFREMCDHYGLVEGGVFSFTRDIQRKSLWYRLVHPRNNGYHLTHHLLPAVPYYRLQLAQQLLSSTPTYRAQGHVCDSYVFGESPAVWQWHSEV